MNSRLYLLNGGCHYDISKEELSWITGLMFQKALVGGSGAFGAIAHDSDLAIAGGEACFEDFSPMK